jgi:hypothetical protein
VFMSKEYPQPSHSPQEIFGFSERENLYDQVTQKRFEQILANPQTNIHEVRVSQNNYGEYLFVTVSREESGQHHTITFYGLGYHQYREQWITKSWRWYITPTFSEQIKQKLSLEQAQALIHERRDYIADEITDEPPSDSAILFTMFADILDEDGSLSELEDLGWTLNRFDAEDEDTLE